MVGENNPKVISIKIDLELESLDDINVLFDKNANKNSIQLCDEEVELTLLSAGNELSFGGESTVELLMSFSMGIASGVVGNIIYSYLCTHAKKLSLNNQRTIIKEEKITQVVETTKIIEKKRKKITKTKKKEVTIDKKIDGNF